MKGTRHIRIPAELHRKMKVESASEGISITKLISELIYRYLEQKMRILKPKKTQIAKCSFRL